MAKYIEDFLTQRTFRVKIGQSLSDEYEQEMGVPQGGVLSCTLFNIAINTVAEVIQGLVSFSLYVDDKRISFAAEDYKEAVTRIQLVLNKLVRWSMNTGFRFNLDKTEWMVFHRRKSIGEPIQFEMDGVPLKEVVEKKFLGLKHDRMLTWKPHVAGLRVRCNKTLNILKIINRNNQGTDARTLLRIYRALVRSKLDYGSQVYGTAPKTYLEPLDPIHHKGLRLCLGAYRSSPNESICVEACEPELKLRREMLQMQYFVRTLQFLPQNKPVRLDDRSLDVVYAQPSNKPLSLGYIVRKKLFEKYNVTLPYVALLKESKLGPWELPSPAVCMSLAQYGKKETSLEMYRQHFIRHKHKADVEMYTDGSKSKEGVGAGVVARAIGHRDSKHGRRLHDIASIFTAELYAIKIALQLLKTCRSVKVVIYSDSRSSLEAIKNQSRCKLVKEILELITDLKKLGNTVMFCWLPGHAGIQGNEIADKEAKAAISRPVVSQQEIPVADIQAAIKRKVIDGWKKQWLETTIEKVKLKEVIPVINSAPLELGLSRKDSVKVTRLRIGHTRLTHSFNFLGEDVPMCIECEVEMSVKHVLLTCGQFALQRSQHYDWREVSLQELLTEREYAEKVLQFLKDIGWYAQL
jgi:ribonuclease HI